MKCVMMQLRTKEAIKFLVAGLILSSCTWITPTAQAKTTDPVAGEIGGALVPVELIPSWLGPVAASSANEETSNSPVTVCFVEGAEPILGPVVPLRAGSFVTFEPYRLGGYSNLQQRVMYYPTPAKADAAWRGILNAAQKCVQRWSDSYEFAESPRLGTISTSQVIERGSVQMGSRSLEITTTSRWKSTTVDAPNRTGGGISIWRKAGPIIVETHYTKVVDGRVASSLSYADKLTVEALTALAIERGLRILGTSS